MRDTKRAPVVTAAPPSPPKHARPKEAASEENVRERILAAAARLLARQGFQRTTLAEVSLEAGVARAEVYRFFSTMNEVLEAVVQTESVRMLEAVTPPPGPKRERLREFFRRQAEMVLRKPSPDCLVVLRLPEARGAALVFRTGMVRSLTEMLCAEILETDSLLVRTIAEGHFEFLKVLYRKLFLDRNSYVYVEKFADYACELFVLELRHLSENALQDQEDLLGVLKSLGEEKNDKMP